MAKDNQFDDLSYDGEAKVSPEMVAKFQKRDYLIHYLFFQNEKGKELLDMWVKDNIITKPITRKGEHHDLVDIGIGVGLQEFVRNILLTCEKVEKNER